MTYRAGKHFLIGLLFFSGFLWPQLTFANNPPSLISPSDNLQVSKSPKLTWEYSGECITSGSCFQVEIDNSADLSSPEKDSYTNSLSYSPQGLAEGNWYWRVKAKDKTEKWSDWSKVMHFTVSSSATTSPTPSSAQSSSSSSPISESAKKTENDFSIKDIPTEINSDQEFEISVSLKLPEKPNTNFYLKGAFKKDGLTNYFGQTLTGEWTGNGEKYSKQLKITSDPSGSWEGKIKVKPDGDDSGFDGTGEYIFKVARYTDSGNGPTWSNESKVKINAVQKPEPSVIEEAEKEITEEEPDISESLVKEPVPSYELKIASVAGESTIGNNTAETKPLVLAERKVNWMLIVSGLLILVSGSSYAFYKIKRERLNAKNYK